MIGMVILSFIIGYPLFMVFVYYLSRIIFTPLDKVAAEQEREKVILLMNARRVRRDDRLLKTKKVVL